MNILKWLKKKKGVSPVIAVVLMIAVAVAIAVIVYAWASGFTSEKTQAESAEAEQLVLEAQDGSNFLGNVYIRNTTSTPTTLSDCYVNGTLQAGFGGATLTGNAVTTVDLSAFSVGAGDEVMLVTEEGTQIKFKAKF